MRSKAEKIKKLLKEHHPIVVMAAGAVSLFLSNIILKEYLTVNEYFEYSIVITLLALLNSFGALGVDQAFLRLSEIKDLKTVIIDKKMPPIALIAILISTSIVMLYCERNLNLSSNGFVIMGLFLGITVSMLIYNLLRITSNFFYAQLILNIWRIGVLIFTCLFILKLLNFSVFINYLICFVWFSIVVVVLLSRKHLSIIYSNKYEIKLIFKYIFNFFISLVTISFLAQGDRLIIESLFDKETFGNYFFIGTLFLFPFSFLQNYIGFKEVVKMKTGQVDINKMLKRVSLGSAVFSCFLLLTTYLLDLFNFLQLDFNNSTLYILLFLIIGNVKMLYAIFSSLVGVKANVIQIKKMNLLFIIIGVILFMLLYLFDVSVSRVLVYFVIMWITRLIIWGAAAKKIQYEKN